MVVCYIRIILLKIRLSMDQKGFTQYIRDVYKHISLTIKAVSVGIQALTGQVSAGRGQCNAMVF